MKRLLAILLCLNLAAFAGTEIIRPTTDADIGTATWVTNNCGIASYASNSTSGNLARDSAGQATSVTYSRAGSFTATIVTSRTFSGWTASTFTYTALRLNVNSSSPGTSADSAGGIAVLVYSTNNGVTWTAIRSADGWTRTTDTIALSVGQDLTKLRVGVCLLGGKGSRSTSGGTTNTNITQDTNSTITAPGNESVVLYDIWTAGDYAGGPAGNGSSAGQAQRGQVQVF